MPNARDNGCLQTAGRSELAMRIPVVKNTHINPTPKRVAFTSAEVKPWKCRICLGGYYGTTFGVHFLGAIVTTGRFVAFAPHVTRGFYKGNAFSVFNVAGSLSEILARLIHVQKHLYSSVDIFLSDSNNKISSSMNHSFYFPSNEALIFAASGSHLDCLSTVKPSNFNPAYPSRRL